MSACRHKYCIESSGKGWCAECYAHGAASRREEVDALKTQLEYLQSVPAGDAQIQAIRTELVTRAERAEASLVDSEARRKGLAAGYNAAVDRVVRLEDALAVAVEYLQNLTGEQDDDYNWAIQKAPLTLARIEAIKKGGS